MQLSQLMHSYTYHNKCKINCIPYKLKKKPAILKYYYINNIYYTLSIILQINYDLIYMYLYVK